MRYGLTKLFHRMAVESAKKHGIQSSVIFGRGRRSRAVLARQEAFWRAYNETGASLTEIGRFWDRDHTTILHGIRRHEERMGVGKQGAA